jgi:RNA polymerase sigma-70 factor (ECF subfamily)
MDDNNPRESKTTAKENPSFSFACDTSCRQRIFQRVRRLLSNDDEAEDLCQEVCIRCLLRRATFRGESSATTWLYRIMKNAYQDHQRKKRRRAESLETDVGAETFRLATAMQSWMQAASEERKQALIARVRAALARLTPQQRQALIWRYVERHPHADIARRFNITEDSARKKAHRAREAFVKAYRGQAKRCQKNKPKAQ